VSVIYGRALDSTGVRLTQWANAMVMVRKGLGHNLKPLERDGLVRMEIGRERRSRVIVVTEAGHAKPLCHGTLRSGAHGVRGRRDPRAARAAYYCSRRRLRRGRCRRLIEGKIMHCAETLHSRRTPRFLLIAGLHYLIRQSTQSNQKIEDQT
jgi:hypothetical protein